jgi:hypothetical protein
MAGRYKVLSTSLWKTADSVQSFLKSTHGLGSIKVEEQIDDNVPRPTLHGKATDNTIICVEVHEDSCYPISVERFVSRAKTAQLPVRLYVAFVEGNEASNFAHQLREARANGVGVLSVKVSGEVSVLSEPLALTLADVRKLDMKNYPSKYKDRLTRAQQTYLQGDPVKGCANIHEVAEEVTRELAKRLHKKNRIAAWVTRTPNFDKDSWYSIANAIYNEPSFTNIFPGTQPAVWAALIAQTKPRNEVSHPPANPRARAERDRKLRTRFEEAGDTLADVLKMIKTAKI